MVTNLGLKSLYQFKLYSVATINLKEFNYY